MKKTGCLVLLGAFLFYGVAAGRIGGGDVKFNVRNAKPALFSHDVHVRDLDLSCQKCHPSPYITKAKDKPVTMAEMNQGKSCGACHNGKDAFTTKGNCSKCHQ